MSSQFSVQNVSAEFIMDVAKAIASSPHPLTKNDLIRSFDKNERYISNAISQCLQLGMIEQNGDYTSSARYHDLIKRSEKSQLNLAMREALQGYPPFLLYTDFITKGYSSEESANMTIGIFRIQCRSGMVEKALRNWGKYAGLVETDKSGKLSIPEAESGLSSEYVEGLLKALRADLQARIFLIETMSQQAFVYLTGKGVGIDDLSDALVNYEKDPKGSANKSSQSFEHFLFKIGEDIGGTVASKNGIMEYVDEIRRASGSNVILRNQVHLCHSIGGLRNMAHHDPDKETGGTWNFTPQGAIVSTLLVPTTVRSIYLHWKENKQEF